ncbi:hypothetical protein AB0J58_35375, partial [Streptosporangium sp. NPDC049644]
NAAHCESPDTIDTLTRGSLERHYRVNAIAPAPWGCSPHRVRDALPERPAGMRVNQANSTELGIHQVQRHRRKVAHGAAAFPHGVDLLPQDGVDDVRGDHIATEISSVTAVAPISAKAAPAPAEVAAGPVVVAAGTA